MEMSNGRRITAVFALIAVAMLSGGAYAYWYFLIRGPFIGATTYDFGDVPLYDETEEVHHTFHLSNRLTTPLTIVAIRPECGCLTARDIRQTLQPDEAFDLPVTLIAKGGERVVLIRVVFDDGSTTALRVRANGRYQPKLAMRASAIVLQEDGAADATFLLSTYETYDDPISPTIVTSVEALHAEFAGWSLKVRPKPQFIDSAPTQWEGRVRVWFDEAKAGQHSNDGSITINWPPAKSLTISVKPAGTKIESSQSGVEITGSGEQQPASQPGR